MLVQVANTAQQEEIQMHRLRVRIYVPRVVTVEVAPLNVLQEGMEMLMARVVLTSALLDVTVLRRAARASALAALQARSRTLLPHHASTGQCRLLLEAAKVKRRSVH